MRELRRRQAEACSEACSIERSWMASLARWKSQLGKARAAAVDGEVGEIRILQREDTEVREREEALGGSETRLEERRGMEKGHNYISALK